MWLVLALGSFALAVAGHGATRRMRSRANAVTRFLCVGCLIGMGLAVYLVRYEASSVEALAALVVYAFLCELYIFLFTLASQSVSATVLLVLLSGPISMEAIAARLGGLGMVALRLERLVATGLLHQSEGGYFITQKGRAVISLFDGLRRFFGQ